MVSFIFPCHDLFPIFVLIGKRHVVTGPLRLIRAHNDHPSIHCLEELASLLVPEYVFFVSQDDKAPVLTGMTATNKQTPLLMHVEHKISLPDHDWVVAARHKLIPSVYATVVIQPDGLGRAKAVGYSEPTYVSKR